jgi:hypothetical protein
MHIAMRDTRPVEGARRITSNDDLHAIAVGATGFVIDPFNRWWHVGSYVRILSMTVGQPKWFAPTRAALDAYMQERLA